MHISLRNNLLRPLKKFRKARSNTDTCKQTHFLHPRRRKLVAGDSLQKRLCRQRRCLAQWKRFEEPSKTSDLSTGHPVLNSGNGPWRCSSMLTAVHLSEYGQMSPKALVTSIHKSAQGPPTRTTRLPPVCFLYLPFYHIPVLAHGLCTYIC